MRGTIMKKNKYKSLEKKLGHTFTDTVLLQTALTHKTYAFESLKPIEYNERLEFLGDSILNFIIAEKLYKTNVFFAEGELTRRRAAVVNNKFLTEQANRLEIGKYLLLGKGEEKQGGRTNATNLANAFEALIGAIYLDSNLETVNNVLFTKLFNGMIEPK